MKVQGDRIPSRGRYLPTLGAQTHRRKSGPLKNIALYGSRTPCRAIHSRFGLFVLGDRMEKERRRKRETAKDEKTKRRPRSTRRHRSTRIRGPQQQTPAPFFFLPYSGARANMCPAPAPLSPSRALPVAFFASPASLSFHGRTYAKGKFYRFLPISCLGTRTLTAHRQWARSFMSNLLILLQRSGKIEVI